MESSGSRPAISPSNTHSPHLVPRHHNLHTWSPDTTVSAPGPQTPQSPHLVDTTIATPGPQTPQSSHPCTPHIPQTRPTPRCRVLRDCEICGCGSCGGCGVCAVHMYGAGQNQNQNSTPSNKAPMSSSKGDMYPMHLYSPWGLTRSHLISSVTYFMDSLIEHLHIIGGRCS